VATGRGPSFSPDGRFIAYTRDPRDGREACSVRILDVNSYQSRLLRNDAEDPFWSRDGTEVALVESGAREGFCAHVVNVQTGSATFTAEPVVRYVAPVLSPDGRYFAVRCFLSRPLTGHHVTDRKTGQTLDLGLQDLTHDRGSYAPHQIQAWSPDGQWMLWTMYAMEGDDEPHPESILQTEIWAVSLNGKTKREIGVGEDADFSADGTHVLWLRPQPGQGRPYTLDLMWSPVAGGEERNLFSRVEAFDAVDWKRQ